MDFGEGEETEPPVDTPWGQPQTRKRLARGVWLFTTSSHGGIWIEPARRVEVPELLREKNFLGTSGEWWEEDCDAPVVALFFGIGF